MLYDTKWGAVGGFLHVFLQTSSAALMEERISVPPPPRLHQAEDSPGDGAWTAGPWCGLQSIGFWADLALELLQQERPPSLSPLPLSQARKRSCLRESAVYLPKRVHLDIFRFFSGRLIDESAHFGFQFHSVSGLFCQGWGLVQEESAPWVSAVGRGVSCASCRSIPQGPPGVRTPGGGGLSLNGQEMGSLAPLKRER